MLGRAFGFLRKVAPSNKILIGHQPIFQPQGLLEVELPSIQRIFGHNNFSSQQQQQQRQEKKEERSNGAQDSTDWVIWIGFGSVAAFTAAAITVFKNATKSKPLNPRMPMGGLDWDEENSTLVHSNEYKFFLEFFRLYPDARREYMMRICETKKKAQDKIDRLMDMRAQTWSQVEKDAIGAKIVRAIENAEIDWNGVWRGSNYNEVLEEISSAIVDEMTAANSNEHGDMDA